MLSKYFDAARSCLVCHSKIVPLRRPSYAIHCVVRRRQDLRSFASDNGDRPHRDAKETSISSSISDERSARDQLSIETPGEDESGRKPASEGDGARQELLHHQSLGFDALGRPLEAIILKNPNKLKTTRRRVPLIPAEPSFTPQLSDLVLEPGHGEQASQDEASTNIEELRPSDTNTITQLQLQQLVTALVDGFTVAQMAGYIAQKQEKLEAQDDDNTTYPWIMKQASWEPAPQRETTPLKPKEKLAHALIRMIWRLDIQEQIEGLGRTQVWIQPEVFQLMTQFSPELLRSIRKELLNVARNENLTLATEDSRLNVYCSKATVPTILMRLDGIAKRVASRSVTTEGIEPENLQPEILKHIGDLTQTILRVDKLQKELAISWLTTEDRPWPGSSSLEDPAAIVRRLLLNASKQPLQTDVILVDNVTKGKAGKAGRGLFVQHHRETKSMSWKDKFGHWSRYVNPATIRSPTVAKDTRQYALELPSHAQVSQRGDISSIVIASFGHILHSRPQLQALNDERNHRLLSPVVPHPAALKQLTEDLQGELDQSTTIILNFMPAACTEDSLIDHATPVRLRMPVDATADLEHFSLPPTSTLHAETSISSTDYLLPNESVDIRLEHTQLTPLELKQESLMDFLTAAEFNLLEGRLRTPSQVAFSIPSDCLEPESAEAASPALRTVPYIFTGLEIHQVVDVEVGANTLRYTSIEAGLHGGQRQVLSLVPGCRQDDTFGSGRWQRGPMTPEHMRLFMDHVEEIATGKLWSWNEGFRLMQPRSREKFTMELMDEQSHYESPENEKAADLEAMEDSIAGEYDRQPLNDIGNRTRSEPVVDDENDGR